MQEQRKYAEEVDYLGWQEGGVEEKVGGVVGPLPSAGRHTIAAIRRRIMSTYVLMRIHNVYARTYANHS